MSDDDTDLSIDDAVARLDDPRWLWIDIRSPIERAAGAPAGASAWPWAELAARLAEHAVDGERPLVLICARGLRSRQACRELRQKGFRNCRSLAGGFAAWRAAGLPEAADGLSVDERARYARQLRLPDFGVAGQRALARARVLVVGCGGLGCPVALYLAAAGVGTLILVDDDRVEVSNLHRQILHDTAALGEAKVASAARRLSALNPGIRILTEGLRLDQDSVDRLLADCDLVVDGSDNFATRYRLADACVRHGKPLVYGAVERYTGQASVFWPQAPGGPWPCYRCLYPEPPLPGAIGSCDEMGVLGVVPGLIGTIQASEAIKLLAGIGRPLLGRLLVVDVAAMRFRELALAVDPGCSCQTGITPAQPVASSACG